MESHIDLKVPSDVGRMLDADEGDARSIRLSKGQAEDLNLNEEEYNSENYQILRELIHDLQLKSAIDRQNMQKTERSIRETAEEIQNTQLEIEKLRKQKSNDEKYLIKQEKKLNKLRCTQAQDSLSDQIRRLENENNELIEQINHLKLKNLEEVKLYRAAKDIDIEMEHDNSESATRALSLQLSLYEQKLEYKDAEIEEKNDRNEQSIDELAYKREFARRQLKQLQDQRLEDHKDIFELNQRLKHDESGTDLIRKLAMKSVGKLKQKFGVSEKAGKRITIDLCV